MRKAVNANPDETGIVRDGRQNPLLALSRHRLTLIACPLSGKSGRWRIGSARVEKGTASQPVGLHGQDKIKSRGALKVGANALTHPYRRLDRCRPCRGSCSAGVFRSLNRGLRRDLYWPVRAYCPRNHLRRT